MLRLADCWLANLASKDSYHSIAQFLLHAEDPAGVAFTQTINYHHVHSFNYLHVHSRWTRTYQQQQRVPWNKPCGNDQYRHWPQHVTLTAVYCWIGNVGYTKYRTCFAFHPSPGVDVFFFFNVDTTERISTCIEYDRDRIDNAFCLSVPGISYRTRSSFDAHYYVCILALLNWLT